MYVLYYYYYFARLYAASSVLGSGIVCFIVVFLNIKVDKVGLSSENEQVTVQGDSFHHPDCFWQKGTTFCKSGS